MSNVAGHLQPHQLNIFIATGLVNGWKSRLRPSTAWAYRYKLQHLLRALETFGAPRIDAPKLRIPNTRGVTATPDEIARLLKDPPPHLRLFILLYLQCGLRFSEAVAVTPRTYNAEAHTVTIPVKGDRIRTAEVTTDVEDMFTAAGPDPDPDKPYIWILRGRRLCNTSLRAAWQAHRDKCGVNRNVTAHDLRRTACTILYHQTKDLRIAQQLLGHKHLESTLRYLAPIAPDEARRYAELLRFDRFHSEVKQ